jgi:preflagellin peptidase FlaK
MFELLLSFFLILICVWAAKEDIETGEIPNEITYPLIIVGLVWAFFNALLCNYLVFLVSILVFLGLFYAYKKNIVGGGDVKLITGICLLNPFNNLVFYVFLFFIFWFILNSVKIYKKWNEIRFGFICLIACILSVVICWLVL